MRTGEGFHSEKSRVGLRIMSTGIRIKRIEEEEEEAEEEEEEEEEFVKRLPFGSNR